MTFAPENTYFSFLATDLDIPQDPEKQRKFVVNRLLSTANILNTKTNGNHQKIELLSGEQWFTSVIDGQSLPKYGFRYTFDLVEINGGPIVPGLTVINLSLITKPIKINGIVSPLPSYGSATKAGPIYVFTGTDFNVQFDNTNPAAQLINVTNNAGVNLTQCYWVFQYLKQ